jgi:hypothetical protein
MTYNKENAAMFFNNILDFADDDLKERLTDLFLDGLKLYKQENKLKVVDKDYIYVDVLDILKYVLDSDQDKVMVSIQNDQLLDFFVRNKSKS